MNMTANANRVDTGAESSVNAIEIKPFVPQDDKECQRRIREVLCVFIVLMFKRKHLPH